MKQHPNIWHLGHLVTHCVNANNTQGDVKDGRTIWFPARPLGFASIGQRLKAAWLVFSGKADAVIWPFDGMDQ